MNWFSQDPDAAEIWFQGLPAGDDREGALVAMITSKQQNGEDVLPLVRSVSDPQERKQMMQSVFYTVMQRDPEAARQLMPEMDLSDAEREQFEQFEQLIEQVQNR